MAEFSGLDVCSMARCVQGGCLVIATGGFLYQTTGSNGDGYRFAEELGHTVTDIYPSLVPLAIEEEFVKELQGLSLKNVEAAIYEGKKKFVSGFRRNAVYPLWVSGPLILSGSSHIAKKAGEKKLKLVIDLKPALTEEQLDQRVLRDFEQNINKQF